MKKYLLLFLLLTVGIILTGCANVQYSIYTNNDGNVIQTVTITPDYTTLEANGYSKQTINERIITIYKDVTLSQEKEFESYRAFFISGELKKEILDRTKHDFTIDEEKGNITLTNTFSSYSDYLYFYCLQQNTTDNQTVTKTSFYYITEIRSQTIFASVPESSIAKYTKKMFSFEKECPFSEKDLTYEYLYKTQDKLLRSDADKKSYDGKYYYHKWKFSGENLSNEIYLYKYSSILVYNWYYLALILSLILFILLIVINEFYQIYKKKKEKLCTQEETYCQPTQFIKK